MLQKIQPKYMEVKCGFSPVGGGKTHQRGVTWGEAGLKLLLTSMYFGWMFWSVASHLFDLVHWMDNVQYCRIIGSQNYH